MAPPARVRYVVVRDLRAGGSFPNRSALPQGVGKARWQCVTPLHFCEAMVSHVLGDFQEDQSLSRWPGLPGRLVSVGGVTVTYAQAAGALSALASSGGIMVASVLKAAGSPLAGCDYRAAAAPFREPAADGTGGGDSASDGASDSWGRGAAGRPATRQAFMRAISAALRATEADEPARHFADALGAARAAFSSDCGYAAAMAKAAVVVQEREHAAALRTQLAQGVHQAVSACEARRAEFTCTVASACGTGACRFATGPLAGLQVPAGPGRMPRPGNHTSTAAAAREGFSTAAAAAALEKAVPYAVAVRVSAGDSATVADRPAA